MSLQVELLEQSFNYIKPYGNLFVNTFYENLLQKSSKLKSLFINIDPQIAKDKLWYYLVSIVENLHQPEILKNLLQGLGARLYTHGVLTKHYPLVRDAFFQTFKEFLGSQWTTEFQEAWKDAYVDFRELMLEGAEQTHKQMASKTSNLNWRQKLTKINTINLVQPVADGQNNKSRSQSPKYNKKLLIGGGVVGTIGIILLMILL